MIVCRALTISLLFLALAGCQTTTQKITPTPQPLQTTVRVNGAKASGNSAPKPIDPSIALDSCASRLQDIEGAMLQYWAINRQLPAHLDDLQSVADAGEPLKLTCPQSNEKFVYIRSGLRSPGRKKAIFIYDPTPAEGGIYWCVIGEDPRIGVPPALDVARVPPTLFRTYQPINAGP